jgi:hypothetical protein
MHTVSRWIFIALHLSFQDTLKLDHAEIPPRRKTLRIIEQIWSHAIDLADADISYLMNGSETVFRLSGQWEASGCGNVRAASGTSSALAGAEARQDFAILT